MISDIKKNRVGTLSFTMKGLGMRKAQEFVVYPGKDACNMVTIQSDTRIGKLDTTNGTVRMSQPHTGGAYFLHLSMDKLTQFTADGWESLVSALNEAGTMNSNVALIRM